MTRIGPMALVEMLTLVRESSYVHIPATPVSPAEGSNVTGETAHPDDFAEWRPPSLPAKWLPPKTDQAINRRRREIYSVIRELEKSLALSTGSPAWADGVLSALKRLEVALRDHVDEIESGGGLFEEILDHAPRLQSAVDELRAEHQQLSKTLDMTMQMAIADDPDRERLRRGANDLLSQLVQHRQRGADVLFDAYMVDIAASD